MSIGTRTKQRRAEVSRQHDCAHNAQVENHSHKKLSYPTLTPFTAQIAESLPEIDLVLTVDITYPHFNLHPDRAVEDIHHPDDGMNRYEPTHLVEDPEVTGGIQRRTESLRPKTHDLTQPTSEDCLALHTAYTDHLHLSCLRISMNHM